MLEKKPGLLILEDGTEFPGHLMGAPISYSAIKKTQSPFERGYGEVVFNTSMTGYQEILTDPAYFGQMICMTAAHIGNTGTNEEDSESRGPWCSGFIVHELSLISSNWRSENTLNQYLIQHRLPGLTGVDTRSLTRRLRSYGVTRGVILPHEEKHLASELFRSLSQVEGRDLISKVTTREPYIWNKSALSGSYYRVVVLDYGVKWNFLRILEQLNCQVIVLPASSSAHEVLSYEPNGVFLSNGPGNPAQAPSAAIECLKKLLGKVPIFGICMGHQILALAMGARTYKLKSGHRGGNQPVLEKASGKVTISTHNHGYAVDIASIPKNVEISHINLNDKTLEGINIPLLDAFSVQYHPEACPGPHDSLHLFQHFIEKMKKHVSKIS